jgi:O-antigen/teichoic acid export membrane protein
MLKHFLQSVGSKVITMALLFLHGVIIARSLGPEGKGIMALYLNVFNMVICLSDLGTRQSTSFYLSKLEYSLEKLNRLRIASLNIAGFLSIAAMSILFYAMDLTNIQIILLVFAAIPFYLYRNFTNGIAMSKRWIGKINMNEIIQAVCELFFTYLLLVVFKLGVISVFIAHLIAMFFASLSNYLWVRKLETNLVQLKDFALYGTELWQFIRKGIGYSIPLFVMGLNYKIDLVILKYYVSEYQIGLYTLGVGIANILWRLPMILSFVVFSYSVSAKNDIVFARKLWNNTKKIMLASLVAIAIIGVASKYLIPIIYGESFVESYIPFLLILPGTFAIISFKILNSNLAARGNPLLALKVFSVAVVINVVMNFILIPRYGINGASISSSVSYVYGSVVYAYYYYKLTFK